MKDFSVTAKNLWMCAIGLGLYFPMILEAHHSTNANFTHEVVSIEGTIERVRFVNPHASVLIKHVGADGQEIFWLIESGARTTLERQGVTLEHLEIGTTVTATGRKGRRNFTMYLQKITYEDGTEFIPQPELF